MSDLVSRLRKIHEERTKPTPLKDVIAICQEAADKIEELENQLENKPCECQGKGSQFCECMPALRPDDHWRQYER